MREKCFICKDSDVQFLLKKDGFDLWSCGKCGLNFVYPQPSKKKLQELYSLKGGYSHSDKGFDVDTVLGSYGKQLKFLERNRAKRVLDVGCASGAFVYTAKKKSFNVVGIDLDRDSIKFGKRLGLDLRHGRIDDMKFGTESFDAVHLGDIIEHVKDPERFLLECLRILKKDGVLIISTPNTNALFPKIARRVYEKFGLIWSHPTPPYHLFDFSDENLKKILERNDVEVLKTDYSRISLAYSIYHTGYFDKMWKKMGGTSKKNIISGALRSIDFKIFLQMMVTVIYFGIFVVDGLFGEKGDQMVVYGRKI